MRSSRSVFEGKEVTSVELSQILINDDNRVRRKATYFARAQINKPLVDGGFIELINLRKEYAKLYGAKDFVEYRLKNDELDASIFENWLPQLHEFFKLFGIDISKYNITYDIFQGQINQNGDITLQLK